MRTITINNKENRIELRFFPYSEQLKDAIKTRLASCRPSFRKEKNDAFWFVKVTAESVQICIDLGQDYCFDGVSDLQKLDEKDLILAEQVESIELQDEVNYFQQPKQSYNAVSSLYLEAIEKNAFLLANSTPDQIQQYARFINNELPEIITEKVSKEQKPIYRFIDNFDKEFDIDSF